MPLDPSGRDYVEARLRRGGRLALALLERLPPARGVVAALVPVGLSDGQLYAFAAAPPGCESADATRRLVRALGGRLRDGVAVAGEDWLAPPLRDAPGDGELWPAAPASRTAGAREPSPAPASAFDGHDVAWFGQLAVVSRPERLSVAQWRSGVALRASDVAEIAGAVIELWVAAYAAAGYLLWTADDDVRHIYQSTLAGG